MMRKMLGFIDPLTLAAVFAVVGSVTAFTVDKTAQQDQQQQNAAAQQTMQTASAVNKQ